MFLYFRQIVSSKRIREYQLVNQQLNLFYFPTIQQILTVEFLVLRDDVSICTTCAQNTS